MHTDAVNAIEKALKDLDTSKTLHVLDKFVPRGSQEFREALFECQNDDDAILPPRERSNTIDTTYKKPHLSVHFASNLVTPGGKKTRSRDDLHSHIHPEGILRHSRERSNTYDGTIQRPRKAVSVKSPLCDENDNDNESAVEKLLRKSPDARKIDLNGLLKADHRTNDSKKTDAKQQNGLSPLRRHKSESAAHSHLKTSPKVSPKTSRKS